MVSHISSHLLTKAAKNILMTDFIKDPSIRQQSREWLQVSGAVTVTPTERGMSVIDDLHTYYVSRFSDLTDFRRSNF